jgi:outer membrane receptor protein involved in Fe transport
VTVHSCFKNIGECLWYAHLLPFLSVLVILPAALSAAGPQAGSPIQGTVRDSTGAVVADAEVTLVSGTTKANTKTDANGRFNFPSVESGTISVTANGFASEQISWSSPRGLRSPLDVVLRPSAGNQEVIVSAARTEMRLSAAPGSTVRLSSTDLVSTPALSVDDKLRQVPGFTLFRRSGSRFANPTSQGVSLRGLGASGPSRALVLEDGIPMVDPFGGWVYWSRIPPTALSSSEVFRGGVSSLYGSDALGGVVQFITREPTQPAFTLEMSGGNLKTPDLSAWMGTKLRQWDTSVATDLFYTEGYILVPRSQRGAVDTDANSKHGVVDLEAGRRFGAHTRVFVRSSYFAEGRHNGTSLQRNDTHLGTLALGVDQEFSGGGSLTARIYGQVQSYNQTFSSIAADRSSESLTNLQRVPSQNLAANIQWTHLLGRRQTFIVGADVSEVIGSSHEQIFSSGIHLADSVSGGRQRPFGIFGEDILRLGKWTLIPGVRFDHWTNFEGSSVRTPVSGPPTGGPFSDRSENAFSPRLSILRPLSSTLTFTASGYRAFRAPTLNELYRSFRLGNVVTQNNPNLGAERLTGGEAGLNATGFERKLQVRGTFFWSDVVNPVANVTLSTTPTLITRQRQNLGRTRSRGFELDGTVHFSKNSEFTSGYAYTVANVMRFPANTALEGLKLPQVPRHQFTWTARYWNPANWMLSAQGRLVGMQFDDDQNLLPLDRFFALDLMVGRAITSNLEVFAAGENVLDQRYQIARTSVLNLGPPVLFRIGLRVNYPGR